MGWEGKVHEDGGRAHLLRDAFAAHLDGHSLPDDPALSHLVDAYRRLCAEDRALGVLLERRLAWGWTWQRIARESGVPRQTCQRHVIRGTRILLRYAEELAAANVAVDTPPVGNQQ